MYILEEDLLYNSQKYLNKSDEYYLLCDNGFSSLRISRILNSLGYKTYSIDGGYSKYVLEKQFVFQYNIIVERIGVLWKQFF